MNDNPKRRVAPHDLVGLQLPTELDVAPDGRSVAVAVSEPDFAHGEHDVQLHVAPDPAPAPRAAEAKDEGEPDLPTRQLTRGLSPVSQPSFSPDGKLIAFVTFRPQPHEDEEDDERENGEDKEQVFLLPVGGGEARRLTEAGEGVELFRWAADGSGVYCLCETPRPPAAKSWRRRRRDDKDDAIVVKADLPRFEFLFQPLDGRVRRLFGGLLGVDDFDVSPDGKWIAYATNHTGRPEDDDKTEIILRDLEKGEERRVSGGRGGAELQPRFSADGRRLFFHGWNDPACAFSRQELFAVDLAAEGAAPRPLLAGVGRDVEDFEPLADGRVAALVAWGMESRLVVADPERGTAEVLPIEGFNFTELVAARRAPVVAVLAEGPGAPPEAGTIDLEKKVFAPLTDLNPEARDWRRAARRRIVWHNEGFDHEGLLLTPDPADRVAGDPPPLVVWLHGGPHWRVQDTLRAGEAEAFCAEGFAVFMPQYRGSSGGPEAYQTAIRGDLGGAEARDVLAGIDEVGRSGLADLSRASVLGASYGGYLVNWLLATTDRFKAGVSIAGIFDLAQDFSTSEYGSWELHYLGGAPWERPQLYFERSPIKHAASITAPLLILHGVEDDNTFLTNGRALFRALRTLGRETEFVLYPREGHGLSEPAHRLDETQRCLEWLGRHALGRIAPRLPGREVRREGARLVLFGAEPRREYAGVRPGEGRVFVEASVLVASEDETVECLRLAPSGPQADMVLVDACGDVYRPVGVPLEVHGERLIFFGGGQLEAWKGEDGRPPSLPAAAVFELPEEPRAYQLRVKDFPPLFVDVVPPED
ncbi:MAG: S9 family peptidase [Candidatus Polarisedimenticolia bacterium]|nr:S9 family peptidase [bacterium]